MSGATGTQPSSPSGASVALGDLSIAGARSCHVPVPPSPLVDGQRRPVRYLRLSVTDRCNFRCRYCMPEEGVPFVGREALLTFEEIERLVRCFVRLGVDRVRITGGEPLLRRGIARLVGRVASIPGVADVAMTTNGAGLRQQAADLAAAGLQRVNVSLDTLRPDRFRDLTRTGDLAHVLAGLDAAQAAGLHPIKLNAVIVRGFNDDELVDLAYFARDRGLALRFIEYMPIGLDGFWSDATFVGMDEVLERLGEHFDVGAPLGYGPEAEVAGQGPAIHRDLVPPDGGDPIRIGIITALSHNFCEQCNRVRLTATGTLQECLAFPGQLSLRDALREGASDEALLALVERALWTKGPGHGFEAIGGGLRTMQAMSVTGG